MCNEPRAIDFPKPVFCDRAIMTFSRMNSNVLKLMSIFIKKSSYVKLM
jgi:hypothetical protein